MISQTSVKTWKKKHWVSVNWIWTPMYVCWFYTWCEMSQIGSQMMRYRTDSWFCAHLDIASCTLYHGVSHCEEEHTVVTYKQQIGACKYWSPVRCFVSGNCGTEWIIGRVCLFSCCHGVSDCWEPCWLSIPQTISRVFSRSSQLTGFGHFLSEVNKD